MPDTTPMHVFWALMHQIRHSLVRRRVQKELVAGVREEDGAPVDAEQNRAHGVTGGDDPGVSGPVETLTESTAWLRSSRKPWSVPGFPERIFPPRTILRGVS